MWTVSSGLRAEVRELPWWSGKRKGSEMHSCWGILPHLTRLPYFWVDAWNLWFYTGLEDPPQIQFGFWFLHEHFLYFVGCYWLIKQNKGKFPQESKARCGFRNSVVTWNAGKSCQLHNCGGSSFGKANSVSGIFVKMDFRNGFIAGCDEGQRNLYIS